MSHYTPKQFLSNATLPSLPDVAASLLSLLDQEEPDFVRVEYVIKKDPAIAAAVMRQANSARFGLVTKVSSIVNALHVIGSSNLRSIALGTSIAASMPPCAAIDKRTVVKYCELHAAIASDIAHQSGADRNMSWLAGFICRLGELLMCQVAPVAALAIEKPPIAPAERWHRQLDHFGFAEGAVMAELASSWNFPDQVVSALAECSNPMSSEYPFRKISGATHVAGIMADAICLGLPSTTVTAYLGVDVLDALSLSQESVVTNYCAHATISLE